MSQSTLATIKNISNSFPTKYLTLCKGKNVLPNHDITKNKLKLEIVADRLKICEWQMISKALEHDNTLQSIEIVSRRAVQCGGTSIENLLKQCKIFHFFFSKFSTRANRYGQKMSCCNSQRRSHHFHKIYILPIDQINI